MNDQEFRRLFFDSQELMDFNFGVLRDGLGRSMLPISIFHDGRVGSDSRGWQNTWKDILNCVDNTVSGQTTSF